MEPSHSPAEAMVVERLTDVRATVSIILYALWWIPGIAHRTLLVIYVPAGVISFLFLVATVKLKLTAGGPPSGPFEFLVVRPREKEDQLELQLARQREERNSLLASEEMDTKVRGVFTRKTPMQT